jgi:Secretion system C-terminal sorting domain
MNVEAYKNAKVKITDLLGKVVYESVFKTLLTSNDISNAGKGIYIYQVQEQSGNSTTGKVMVE